MSDARRIGLLFERAAGRLRRGDLDGAVVLLEQVLAIDPSNANAHAMLAMVLIDMRLVSPARAEAELALSLDPEAALCVRVHARVLYAEGKRRQALVELERAIELDPTDADLRVFQSAIQVSLGQDGEPALREALELEPEDPDVLAACSRFERGRGRIDAAENYAREALEIDPEHSEGLIAMGWVLLSRGQVEDARDHAATCIREDPSSEDALALLAACRARQSLVLGLWFRFNMKVSQLGDRGGIAVLIGAYLLYSVLVLMFADLDWELAGSITNYLWLAIVAYTWIGPVVFRRMLQREVGELQISKDY